MKIVASALALCVFAALSATSVAAEDNYKVSFEVREAGELLSAPMVIVRADTEASVAREGDNWFTLEFTVSPTDGGAIEFNAVYESATSNLVPMMELELGKTATIGVGDVELTVTVEPADV
jgi:hypothetical protein